MKNKNLYKIIGGSLVALILIVTGVVLSSGEAGTHLMGYLSLQPANKVSDSKSLPGSQIPSASVKYKVACVVRDGYTGVPLYSDADSGKGYVKKGKGTSFNATLALSAAVKDVCKQADYSAMGQTFCAQNPGKLYILEVAAYNPNDSVNSHMLWDDAHPSIKCAS